MRRRTAPTPVDERERRRRLRAWYRGTRRDLPWRRTRDPYAIWVAETMLQQTRSETVVGYHARFLRRFPTIEALARASPARVLAAWSGLGYYARARNLHRAAREVIARHGGRLPASPEDLGALPGVGRYTLGAVGSIAFDLPLPLVDGNVARVFARWFAIDRPVSGSDPELWQIATTLVPRRRPGEWNQALMELGAVVCTPRTPRCDACPVRSSCRAFREGRVHELPVARPRSPSRTVRRAIAIVEHEGRVLLLRRTEGRLLHRLWELPTVDLAANDDPCDRLRSALDTLGVRSGALEEITTIRHAILDRRFVARVFHGHSTHTSTTNARWHRMNRLPHLPLSAATTHALRAVGLVTRSIRAGNDTRTPRSPRSGGAFPAAE